MAEIEKQINIYQAIAKCMEEIGAVGKNDVNKTQGFKYRGIDAVMNALNPALVKNHVFIVPEVLEHTREERTTNKGSILIYSICRVKFTFFAEDGSSISAITVGEGMDSGDKATNKAMSIALKYACFQVFFIPTEELMDDPDKESPEPSKRNTRKGSAGQQKDSKKLPAPITDEQIRKLEEFVDAYADMCENVKPDDVWKILKEKFQFKAVSDLTTEVADTVIQQVETWYKKKAG